MVASETERPFFYTRNGFKKISYRCSGPDVIRFNHESSIDLHVAVTNRKLVSQKQDRGFFRRIQANFHYAVFPAIEYDFTHMK